MNVRITLDVSDVHELARFLREAALTVEHNATAVQPGNSLRLVTSTLASGVPPVIGDLRVEAHAA